MKNTFISKPRKLIPLFQTPLDLKKRSLDNIRDGLLFKNLNNQFEKKESPVQELKLLNYLFNRFFLFLFFLKFYNISNFEIIYFSFCFPKHCI